MAGKHAHVTPLSRWRRVWFGLAALLGAAAIVSWMTLFRPDADQGLLLPAPTSAAPVPPSPSSSEPVLPPDTPVPTASSPLVVPSAPGTTATTRPPTGVPTPRRTTAGAPTPAVTFTAAPGEPTTPPVERTTLAAAPPTTPTPTPVAATAAYRMASSWQSGFVSEVRVTNTSSRSSTWTVTVTHASTDGVTAQNAWNASFRQSGSVIVFTGGPLAPGTGVTFGYQAGKRVTGRATPTGCTIGGAACSVS